MNTLDRLLAQDAILKTCHQLLYSEDELDRTTMLSCFHPTQKISLDMSGHLQEIPPTTLTPEEWWQQVHSILGGFTATQHFAGNAVVTFDPEDEGKAHVKQSVTAYHCIEEDGVLESVTARAVQEFGMECFEGRWVIGRLVIWRSVPLDNGGLYLKAMERAKDVRTLRKPKD
ncbi:hypothetical protein M409DRAFT_26957 [Zasmidium cellare ATCC 36951]|uniref:SnoaL-like domain-containing protein n=1 Tax=Zasmidium cellare ATCC 36951 TaxID=1080233 RepID=A0A6A6C910_ZASCE|nr:uncharacterized protein M409DRAFT_26957 [Zasmidium cellare ATCC 36951]KAF2162720.1 hypothetical protein M409DRAFT_26957 [Zasmidium cellare ATCC 36951]